jgi:HD-GYP domain-containing protein (c-di-GMP phosphodiesterase class II)
MALIPFSPDHLRVNDALPFGVRDAAGQLLLAGGQVIESRERLAQLRGCRLFVDDRESEEWRRRQMSAMDEALRQNLPLNKIVQARPELQAGAKAAEVQEQSLPGQWLHVRMLADMALSEAARGPGWVGRMQELAARVRQLAARNPDAALYLLVQTAQHDLTHYSRHHALLCIVVCELMGRMLQWPEAEIDSLVMAALTMNISVTQLQDQLAQQEMPLLPAQREALDGHPEASARLLQAAGVTDTLWIDTVRLHHDDSRATVPLAALSTAERLARALRRADIFTAKLSRRASRIGTTPTQAARDACLGPNGQPDEVGAAILKALGLYPPGTYVRLVNGEAGVVMVRGRRANLPLVAVVVNGSGVPLTDPTLRDTLDRKFAVESALRSDAIKVRLNDERMLKATQLRRRF